MSIISRLPISQLDFFKVVIFFSLRYSWHTIYSLQAHYIVIWHLCALWNDSHSKSSYHLSPYTVYMILLSIFPMLYITVAWLILYLQVYTSWFPSPILPPPLRQPPICFLPLTQPFISNRWLGIRTRGNGCRINSHHLFTEALTCVKERTNGNFAFYWS